MLALLILLADFVVCDDPAYQYNPNTTYQDSLYYVFWSDMRQPNPVSIYAARVKDDGTTIDTSGQFLYQGNPLFGAKVAYGGQDFLAVFRDSC